MALARRRMSSAMRQASTVWIEAHGRNRSAVQRVYCVRCCANQNALFVEIALQFQINLKSHSNCDIASRVSTAIVDIAPF